MGVALSNIEVDGLVGVMVYEELGLRRRSYITFKYGTGRTCYRDPLADLHRTDHHVGGYENNRRPHETIRAVAMRRDSLACGASDPIMFNYRPNSVSINVHQQRRLSSLSWSTTHVL
jgi:hypothetical protein